MSKELSRLSPPKGANRRAKHKGRGMSSGNGKTAGRGQKGQKSRKSGHVRPGFEGGSMPIQRRLPKRGFTNIFARELAEVRTDQLEGFADNARVDLAALRAHGLARGKVEGVKLIGNRPVAKPLTLVVDGVTKGARAAIEQAGGSVEVLAGRNKWVRPDSRAAKRAQKA